MTHDPHPTTSKGVPTVDEAGPADQPEASIAPERLPHTDTPAAGPAAVPRRVRPCAGSHTPGPVRTGGRATANRSLLARLLPRSALTAPYTADRCTH